MAVVAAIGLGLVLLVLCTDQFVKGAVTVAGNLKVSAVLVGAVILGCGTGLPELALSFYGSSVSPWRQVLHLKGQGGHGLGLTIFFIVLSFIFVLPTLFPGRIRRHSPIILIATIMFSTLLRGSLDEFEGFAMLLGFVMGIGWIMRSNRVNDDPFRPIIDDRIPETTAYIETPVMTPVQIGMTRVLFGLFGTALGAYILAFGAIALLKQHHAPDLTRNLVFVTLGSLLPHVVVALQALRRHNDRLAIGNLIGSSLFNSLVLGGMVAIIRPYQVGGHLGLASIGIMACTALLTWMLLHTEDELGPKQGLILLGAYVGLVALTVL
jgi:cation:H+ antiporter